MRVSENSEPSLLESLPKELMCMILKELIGPRDGPVPLSRVFPDRKPYKQIVNTPSLHPAVLRLNKDIHAIAKPYLDEANEWIAFDIDRANLILPEICITVPVLVIDPEAEYALPRFKMSVRVKLFDNGERSDIHRVPRMTCWPRRLPEKQPVLVQMRFLKAFLEHIRIVELSFGVRTMPGEIFSSLGFEDIVALRGFHGLCIRVELNEDYNEEKCVPLLNLFEMFHGPLNEVTILGCRDAATAQVIESSISMPRPLHQSTFDEMLLHMARTLQITATHASQGHWVGSRSISNQMGRIPANLISFDTTPWLGYPSELHKISNFECLISASLEFYAVYATLASTEIWQDVRFSQARLVVPWHCTKHLTSNFRLWIDTVKKMADIFSTGIDFSGGKRWAEIARAEVLRHPNLLWEYLTHGYVVHKFNFMDQMPSFKTYLEEAQKTADDLKCLVRRSDDALTLPTYSQDDIYNYKQILKDCALKISKFIRESKPPRWVFHESVISERLKKKGILNYMTNVSEMDAEEQGKHLFVEALSIDEQHGNLYCF